MSNQAGVHRNKTFKLHSIVGGNHVWQVKNVHLVTSQFSGNPFFFECGLSVDADGAPTAYAPHGTPGALDHLGNAGHPGNWWGIVTHNGKNSGHPVVQSGVAPEQPYKGFYISKTSLVDSYWPETDIRRWTDATKVPYVALPLNHLSHLGLKLGDFVLLINGNNGKFTYAVFADGKHRAELGEVSICAASALGAPSDPKSGSLPRGIIRLVFPGSGVGQGSIPDAKTIAVCGKMSLHWFANHVDKHRTFPTAYPDYPLFANALKNAGYP